MSSRMVVGAAVAPLVTACATSPPEGLGGERVLAADPELVGEVATETAREIAPRLLPVSSPEPLVKAGTCVVVGIVQPRDSDPDGRPLLTVRVEQGDNAARLRSILEPPAARRWSGRKLARELLAALDARLKSACCGGARHAAAPRRGESPVAALPGWSGRW